MSNSEEVQFLTIMLSDLAENGNRYGYPEQVLETAKHISHVCLDSTIAGWTFQQTHKLWEHKKQILFGDNINEIIPIILNDDRYILLKWDDTDLANRQILQAYNGIWHGLKTGDSHFYTGMKQWIEYLLSSKYKQKSPEITAMVLYNLMSFSIDDNSYHKLFLPLNCAVSFALTGNMSRGLLDVGAIEDWPERIDIPKTSIFQSSWEPIGQLIQLVINYYQQ